MDVDLSKFKIHSLKAEVTHENGDFVILGKLEVDDVYKTGSKSRIEQRLVIPDTFEEGVIRVAVRKVILDLLEHEIDECLFIDGTRAQEPKHGV